VDVKLQKETDKGLQESSSTATSAASFIGGFLMYIFIFLYGSMVLRGVQEEKQNRVVEVMISSVKPFQLMLGKIIGIALVGLTQFFIWVGLAILITAFSGQIIMMFAHDPMLQQTGAQVEMNQAAYAFNTLPIGLLIAGFIFYFSCGYLLYSSLFAAVGAAVDSQTDSNQFMFPISIPIFLAISMIPSIMDNPDSTVAFWISIIPLTSPIIMMARLPFEVPAWQIILSALVLIGGFLVTTWAAAKVYRTGILMYGKKVTFKELAKWLFYKD
jgi:ABC-2 type transport system permease protein